jgi:hypothetical protein
VSFSLEQWHQQLWDTCEVSGEAASQASAWLPLSPHSWAKCGVPTPPGWTFWALTTNDSFREEERKARTLCPFYSWETQGPKEQVHCPGLGVAGPVWEQLDALETPWNFPASPGVL